MILISQDGNNIVRLQEIQIKHTPKKHRIHHVSCFPYVDSVVLAEYRNAQRLEVALRALKTDIKLGKDAFEFRPDTMSKEDSNGHDND